MVPLLFSLSPTKNPTAKRTMGLLGFSTFIFDGCKDQIIPSGHAGHVLKLKKPALGGTGFES